MVTNNDPPAVVHSEAMLETDVPGRRTLAVMAKDGSMEPLFSEGEIVFVNPSCQVAWSLRDGGKKR
jgi:phage repressor protein C with HTH and peptisase S24 domain